MPRKQRPNPHDLIEERIRAAGSIGGLERLAGIGPEPDSGTGNGAFAVADPRTNWPDGAHQSTLRVHRYDEPSHTVTGSDRVASGALCVADPRTDERLSGANGVIGWQEASGAVEGESLPNNGAFAVADPRPGMSREAGDAYLTAGHYGIVPWTEPTGTVSSAGQHDNGKWSVADPRMPAATDRLVAVIRSMDDTWHRPFTTLELAALQSLVDPEEQLELDGLSTQIGVNELATRFLRILQRPSPARWA